MQPEAQQPLEGVQVTQAETAWLGQMMIKVTSNSEILFHNSVNLL